MADEYVTKARAVIEQALHGELDLLKACRTLSSLRFKLPVADSESFDVIVGIESELDDMPDDDQMPNWQREALSAALNEKAEYLTRVRPVLEDALRDILNILRNWTRY